MSEPTAPQAPVTQTRPALRTQTYLAICLPVGAVLVAAVTLLLCFLPRIRTNLAWRAVWQGEFSSARALASELDADTQERIRSECTYWQAVTEQEAGAYEQAAALFLTIPNHRNAAEWEQACRYRIAYGAEQAGDWGTALSAYLALGGYRDSVQSAERCRMTLAEQLYQAGQTSAAISAYLDIGSDAAMERAGQIAMELCGKRDPTAALNDFLGLSEADFAHLTALITQRSALPVGVLAVGFSHTVGVTADGTAVACGDNQFGQCAVDGWRGVRRIAAGAFHTVALLEDGTVVACGDNRYGQCNVSAWQNVVQVVACDYDTAALTADGTVLYTGYHDFSETASWPKDLTSLCGGSFGLAALRENGSAMTTTASGDVASFSKLVGLWTHTGFAVGLRQDGTVQNSGVLLPSWADVLTLSVSDTRVLALHFDGTVSEFVFRDSDAFGVTGQTNVLAVAAGNVHTAILYADGAVRCFGSNDAGQCEVSLWSLRTTAP